MPQTKVKKIWFVGGETGGHVVPLLAVAEVMAKKSDIRIEFVGSRGGIEERLARTAGYPFLSVMTGKLRRGWGIVSVIRNLFDVFKFGIGITQSFIMIKRHKPKAVFSKGGPVSLPVVVAAGLLRVPVVTHESDIVMGQSNRFIARMAQVVMTGFPVGNYPYIEASKLIHVGIPIRSEFCRRHAKPASRRPMVLVTGGSQGAASVGEMLLTILPDLLQRADVMHVCGESMVNACQAVKSTLEPQIRDHYGFVAYTNDIADYIAESTVVVTRASSQIFEIASIGRAMICIPLPWSANNHQLKNAQHFASHDAAIILRQENLTPERLYETISSVLDDAKLRHSLETHVKTFNSCESAARVAEILSHSIK